MFDDRIRYAENIESRNCCVVRLAERLSYVAYCLSSSFEIQGVQGPILL